MSKKFLIAVTAACLAFAPVVMAQTENARATTVKSSKSNTSDRKGQTPGTGANTRATTVKSSKSNTSDRMGGGGGAKGAGGK